MRLFKLRFLLSCLLLIIGCGPNSDIKTQDDIYKALNFLSVKDCQSAIDTLKQYSSNRSNVGLMETLTASYACRANYNTTEIITLDFPKIGDPLILGGFTRFTNASSMNSPDDDGFTDMYTALQILLYAGGIPTNKDPTVQRRENVMNARQAEKVNAFLGYLLMDQMGRYLYYYGNSSDTGVKASGTQTPANTCLVNYTNVNFRNPVNGDKDIKKYLKNVAPGSCVDIAGSSGMEGHPQLGNDTDGFRTDRLCQGVIIYNNFVEIISNILDPADYPLVFDAFQQVNDNLVEALPLGSTLINILNLENCYKEYKNDSDNLQIFFTLTYETLFL